MRLPVTLLVKRFEWLWKFLLAHPRSHWRLKLIRESIPFFSILIFGFLAGGHTSLQSRFVFKAGGVIPLVEG